jgi:predicted nucleic acid-binding protein
MTEPGSDEFNRAVEGREDLVVSDLTVTEVVSALARRFREGALTREIVRSVQRAMMERLDGGTYHRIELTRDVHRRAEHFLLTVTGISLRAADALHLALATSSRALSLASFDTRLRAAARAVGLATYPP